MMLHQPLPRAGHSVEQIHDVICDPSRKSSRHSPANRMESLKNLNAIINI
jgi:hypothetical protein